VRETAVLTKSLVHEVRFEYRKDFSQTTPRVNLQAINVLDSFNGGGGQNNNLSNNRNSEFSNLLMYSGAKWTIKTGFQGLYRIDHSEQKNNFLGTYTFSSLDYYFAGKPLQFTRTFGNPLLDVNQFETAVFIQNDWKMTKKFNLSFGARYEGQTNISAYHNLDPRMGFAYQLTKTMALRGGLGVFHQRLDIGIVEGLMRLDGARQQQIVISHPSFPDPFLDFDISSIPISHRTRASELVLPYTTDASVSLEKSLPKGLALTFSWYGNRGVHLYRSRNINAPLCLAATSRIPLKDRSSGWSPRAIRDRTTTVSVRRSSFEINGTCVCSVITRWATRSPIPMVGKACPSIATIYARNGAVPDSIPGTVFLRGQIGTCRWA